MSLPNKLTMVRVVLIPVMVILYLLRPLAFLPDFWCFFLMGIIFLGASFTDYLDGHIARRDNLVTTFGKFMDPLADKLLVMTALLILLDASLRGLAAFWMPFWVPLIVLSRELIVTSIRLVAIDAGKVIAASKLGKMKTGSTMAAIGMYFLLVPLDIPVLNLISTIVMGFAVLMTLVSGVDYFLKNRSLIFQSK